MKSKDLILVAKLGKGNKGLESKPIEPNPSLESSYMKSLPVETSADQVGMGMESAKSGGMPVMKSTPMKSLDVMKAIRATDIPKEKTPIGEVELGPTEVQFSPIKKYLNKKGR